MDKLKCLKRIVSAFLIDSNGRVAFGQNNISNPFIKECPREFKGCKIGEGYEMCKNVCLQNDHAEIMAIKGAIQNGIDPRGLKMIIHGHDRICDRCKKVCEGFGIIDFVFVN